MYTRDRGESVINILVNEEIKEEVVNLETGEQDLITRITTSSERQRRE